MSMMREVFVAGVGSTIFGRHLDRTLGDLSSEAWDNAAADAGLGEDDIDSVFFSNAANGLLYGQEMIRGQVALKTTGLSGKPLVNIENACASGSSAAHLAWLSVASGSVDTAIAIGAEKLFHVDKARSFAAIESGTDLGITLDGPGTSGSVMMGAYAAEARAYAEKYGSVENALAQVAVKNRMHASANPKAQFRTPISLSEVLGSRLVAPPLRLLMCSPITDGATAVIFTSNPLGPKSSRAVSVAASVVSGYRKGTSVVRDASSRAFAMSGLLAKEMDVLQLHDACAFAELNQMEDISLVAPGGAIEAVLAGETALGGAFPINTDGGLMSRGHALGATGLAQIMELVLQLRGLATGRQVVGARQAMAVNSGGWMGDDYAAGVVTLLTAA